MCGSRDSSLHILFSVHPLHAGRKNSSCTIPALILGIVFHLANSGESEVGGFLDGKTSLSGVHDAPMSNGDGVLLWFLLRACA